MSGEETTPRAVFLFRFFYFRLCFSFSPSSVWSTDRDAFGVSALTYVLEREQDAMLRSAQGPCSSAAFLFAWRTAAVRSDCTAAIPHKTAAAARVLFCFVVFSETSDSLQVSAPSSRVCITRCILQFLTFQHFVQSSNFRNHRPQGFRSSLQPQRLPNCCASSEYLPRINTQSKVCHHLLCHRLALAESFAVASAQW